LPLPEWLSIRHPDDAISDAHWIKEHGLRGGVLLPNFGPDITWLKPYFHRDYDRLWAALQDLDIPLTCTAALSPRVLMTRSA
jgi:hypothetical protein